MQRVSGSVFHWHSWLVSYHMAGSYLADRRRPPAAGRVCVGCDVRAAQGRVAEGRRVEYEEDGDDHQGRPAAARLTRVYRAMGVGTDEGSLAETHS